MKFLKICLIVIQKKKKILGRRNLTDNTAVLKDYDTIWQVLEDNAKKCPQLPAVREKAFGIWQTWTWSDYSKNANNLALGLIELGMKDKSPVAIVGNNRQQLYAAMFSIQMAGGVPVPIYQDAVAEEMLHVLQHSEAKIIIAEDQEQVDKVIELGEKLPNVEKILFLEDKSMRSYESNDIVGIRKALELGEKSTEKTRSEILKRKKAQTSESTGVILYTSGTTGKSKGVVLSHANILTAASGAINFDKLRPGMEVVSYLPMAWVGDFIFSTCMAPLGRLCINCPESRDTLMADLKEIGPDFFFGPPRIFEGLLTSIMIRIEDASAIKKRLFHYFMNVAKKVGGDVLEGKSVGLFNRALYALGDFIIFGPLRNNLGMSRVSVGYTAGEAIGPEIFEFFRSIGIELIILDIAQIRGGEIIVDLNYPIQKSLEGSFDIIFDGGTIEHCFNIPQAMVNILSMLKVGGHIYHSNPLVSLNHGFYNLNPTFYSDFYIDNGHKLVAPIYAIERNIENKEDKDNATVSIQSFELPNTKRFSLPNDGKYISEFSIQVIAEKTSNNAPSWPVQTKYKRQELR